MIISEKKKSTSRIKSDWSAYVQALEDKKATDIAVLDVQGVCSFTDHIIICTGTSDRQIKAIAEHIIGYLRETVGERGHRAGAVGASGLF